jgi:hypothetical protein
MGKLLVLPANVRLDWKVIARYKHFSIFGLVFCNEEKKFYGIDTRPLLDLSPDGLEAFGADGLIGGEESGN